MSDEINQYLLENIKTLSQNNKIASVILSAIHCIHVGRVIMSLINKRNSYHVQKAFPKSIIYVDYSRYLLSDRMILLVPVYCPFLISTNASVDFNCFCYTVLQNKILFYMFYICKCTLYIIFRLKCFKFEELLLVNIFCGEYFEKFSSREQNCFLFGV